MMLCDAQTSGGLLVAIPPSSATRFERELPDRPCGSASCGRRLDPRPGHEHARAPRHRGRGARAPAQGSASNIRPTQGMVKQAIFNMVGPQHRRTRDVLDLFAGSGALGIEALSRGAARVTFVDREPRGLAILRQNLDALGFKERARIVRADVVRWLEASPDEIRSAGPRVPRPAVRRRGARSRPEGPRPRASRARPWSPSTRAASSCRRWPAARRPRAPLRRHDRHGVQDESRDRARRRREPQSKIARSTPEASTRSPTATSTWSIARSASSTGSIVAVAANPEKRQPLFTVEERMELIRAVAEGSRAGRGDELHRV